MNNLSSEELVQIHATAREARLPVVWTEKKALAHFKEKITPELVEAMARELLALREAGKEPVAWEVKGILCHTLEEAQLYVGEPEPLFGAPQSPDMPTDDERLMEIEGISVVNLPHEFYSDQGVVVNLEKVMAALAVNGVEYKRSARVGEKANILSDAESDRKRDEAVIALIYFDIERKASSIQELYPALYDAIAAGKIPGIRIE